MKDTSILSTKMSINLHLWKCPETCTCNLAELSLLQKYPIKYQNKDGTYIPPKEGGVLKFFTQRPEVKNSILPSPSPPIWIPSLSSTGALPFTITPTTVFSLGSAQGGYGWPGAVAAIGDGNLAHEVIQGVRKKKWTLYFHICIDCSKLLDNKSLYIIIWT